MNELTKEEIEAILTVFSNMNLSTNDSEFLQKAIVIDSVKRKMGAALADEAEKVKVVIQSK